MCDPSSKVALAAPRGHAKTTACTHSFVLANVCFRVKQHVLIISDTEGQAVDFLRDIKTEFLENDLLIKTFKFSRLLKDSEREIIGQFEDGGQFRIFVKGSEQKIRGSKWRNKRPDLVVGDDLENDEIVLNEERRRKFKNWFYSAVLPCGSDNCDYRIVGTILHLDSVLENLMPQIGAEDTVDDGLRSYSTGKHAWKSVRYRAHDEHMEQILWPEKFPKERLKSIREDYVRQGIPEAYAQEYLNYPIDEATAFFRNTDFSPLSSDNVDAEDIYVSVDLAISQRDGRAYTVFSVAGVDSAGKLRIRDIIRERMDALEIIETFFTLEIAWKPEGFFVEEENIARTLGPLLTREMSQRGLFLTIHSMTASQDKIKRARPLQAMMRAGAIEFDEEAPWFPQLQTEFLQFPRSKYMDQVDAVAWLPLGLRKILDAASAEERAEQEYEELLQESEGSLGYYRNRVTGY